MNLDNGLWICGLLVETALVALLIYRRAWRNVPFFLIFCGSEVLMDLGAFVVRRYAGEAHLFYYLLSSVISSILEFAVLVELAWSVLRPLRSSLPRRTPFVIGIVVLALGAAIWPFSAVRSFSNLAPLLRQIAQLQQTTSILRVLFFLALAGCSQLLSIGWRDRELQIATGLGFVSLVNLGTAMLRVHQSTWIQWLHSNQLLVGCYISSLAYWVFCFSQKEAERREFTPQMQNLLLAVAGVARAERTALTAASRPATQQRNGQ